MVGWCLNSYPPPLLGWRGEGWRGAKRREREREREIGVDGWSRWLDNEVVKNESMDRRERVSEWVCMWGNSYIKPKTTLNEEKKKNSRIPESLGPLYWRCRHVISLLPNPALPQETFPEEQSTGISSLLVEFLAILSTVHECESNIVIPNCCTPMLWRFQ